MMNNRKFRFRNILMCDQYSRLLHLPDAKIHTDDGFTFDVHKIVLAFSSEFFREMFRGTNRSEREYRISKINGECLNEILIYIYMNHIRVTHINLKDLLIAAHYLLLKDLYLKLKLQVKNYITDANCLKLYLAASELNDKAISHMCLRFIHVKFDEIMNQKDDLVNLPVQLLKNILSSQNSNVERERTKWKAIINWTEACMESRLSCVQSLLTTLTIDKIGESLATEIIKHDIVHNNLYMKSVIVDIKSNNCDCHICFLQKISNDFQFKKFKIPKKLTIISKYYEDHDEQGIGVIFISYHETLISLWQKITHVNFEPEYLITTGSNLYIFEKSGPRCVKLNLRTMKMEPMRNFIYSGQTLVAIENCIYSLFQNINGTYNIEAYNVDDDKLFQIPSLNNVRHGSAVAIGRNFLVIGVKSELDGMTLQLLNRITEQWSLLSPPKIYRSHFEAVPYHGQIYLLGGVNADNEIVWDVEVYDPELDFWKEIPRLPFNYQWVATIVLNDQMIVYDLAEEYTSSAVRWNDIEDCWETLGNHVLPEKLYRYRFCAVSDIETIKILTKRN